LVFWQPGTRQYRKLLKRQPRRDRKTSSKIVGQGRPIPFQELTTFHGFAKDRAFLKKVYVGPAFAA
jgi:hypothetical protein